VIFVEIIFVVKVFPKCRNFVRSGISHFCAVATQGLVLAAAEHVFAVGQMSRRGQCCTYACSYFLPKEICEKIGNLELQYLAKKQKRRDGFLLFHVLHFKRYSYRIVRLIRTELFDLFAQNCSTHSK
jgi:hypothetical protein